MMNVMISFVYLMVCMNIFLDVNRVNLMVSYLKVMLSFRMVKHWNFIIYYGSILFCILIFTHTHEQTNFFFQGYVKAYML